MNGWLNHGSLASWIYHFMASFSFLPASFKEVNFNEKTSTLTPLFTVQLTFTSNSHNCTLMAEHCRENNQDVQYLGIPISLYCKQFQQVQGKPKSLCLVFTMSPRVYSYLLGLCALWNTSLFNKEVRSLWSQSMPNNNIYIIWIKEDLDWQACKLSTKTKSIRLP